MVAPLIDQSIDAFKSPCHAERQHFFACLPMNTRPVILEDVRIDKISTKPCAEHRLWVIICNLWINKQAGCY